MTASTPSIVPTPLAARARPTKWARWSINSYSAGLKLIIFSPEGRMTPPCRRWSKAATLRLRLSLRILRLPGYFLCLDFWTPSQTLGGTGEPRRQELVLRLRVPGRPGSRRNSKPASALGGVRLRSRDAKPTLVVRVSNGVTQLGRLLLAITRSRQVAFILSARVEKRAHAPF
jgi:hypothetical protein